MSPPGSEKPRTGGLAGVVAGQTAISTVGKEGLGFGLTYRGYSIEDLAREASFEEVAYLLIKGELPAPGQLDEYQRRLMGLRDLPDPLREILVRIPASAHPMDVLRTGCSALGCLEPEVRQADQGAIADRLVAALPSMLLDWYHASRGEARINLTTTQAGLAGHFLEVLHGKPPGDRERQTVNVSLILYAEHEFNASTFAARVAASTLSDFYSGVTAAIGTLRGPLHGGANEASLDLIRRFADPDEAEAGILEALAAKAKIMGFGHRVYREFDPRSRVIEPWVERLADTPERRRLYDVGRRIVDVMWREKRIFPNVDFYSSLVYHYLSIPQSLFTPLFVLSRISGWSAHIIEQRADNRLIRPDADYTGPEPRAYLRLEDRSS
jgi:2-methylcitrate synthase